MKTNKHELSKRLFKMEYENLTEPQKHVLHHMSEGTHISREVIKEHEDQSTLGQRLADTVASFGGSWTFISIFGVVMFFWILLNSYLILFWKKPFDPFPYILLNLILSMLAAIQAPVILMSQNRQAAKDRDEAAHDYEVNLKSELEIMELHEKIDQLRERQWEELVTKQEEQTRLLTELIKTINYESPKGNA